MSEFNLVCPKCGKTVTAGTGLFAKKKINCECGNIVDVRKDRMASCECRKCGNIFVVDQSKPKQAVCSVCHEPVKVMDNDNKIWIACKKCSAKQRVDADEENFICPSCGNANDVKEQMTERNAQKKSAVELFLKEHSRKRAEAAIISVVLFSLVGIGAGLYCQMTNTTIQNFSMYRKASAYMSAGDYGYAAYLFENLSESGYHTDECKDLANECYYRFAQQEMDNKDYGLARMDFYLLGDYKDSEEKAQECAYYEGCRYMEAGSLDTGYYTMAATYFRNAGTYMDSEEKAEECEALAGME